MTQCNLWIVYSGLTRRFTQENLTEDAQFSKFMTTKVLEPVYNFRGIEPKAAGDNLLLIAGLLGFYVLYTVWYGVSIMLVFGGLGMNADGNGNKAET